MTSDPCGNRAVPSVGSGSLVEKERVVLSVETFSGEVSNGGLMQYLGNESQAFANWASDAFAKIGIPEFAELMRKVEALFPNSKIPETYDECWAVVENLDDETLDEIERVFWERWNQDKSEIRRKLYAYITGS